jgi:hypothetical protein
MRGHSGAEARDRQLTRPGSKVLLQRVRDDKRGKNRMHLDLEVADIDGLAIRLENMGARRSARTPYQSTEAGGSLWRTRKETSSVSATAGHREAADTH